MYGPGSRGLLSPAADFMSISLLVLGIASFLFHATLRHALQFGDELAMLGLAWSLLQGTLMVRQSPERARYITLGLAIVFPLVSAFYIWSGKIIYHVTAFIIMIAGIVLRGHHLFHWLQPAFPEAKRLAWRKRGRRALLLLVVGYGRMQLQEFILTPLGRI